MRIREALQEATARLQAAGVSSPRLDAELLLAEVLGRSRAYLVAHADDVLSPNLLARYREWISRRARGEPLAYIVGYAWFYDLKLHVTPDVLVPRPETELLVDLALADLRARRGEVLRVADVGTGSGAIALAVAQHEPRARVLATDISARALRVAVENARTLSLGARVTFIQADLLAPVAGPFHLIVANLPYVGKEDESLLAPEVKEYEPPEALWAGQDGLALIRRLLVQAPQRLSEDGTLVLEVGYQQSEAVQNLAHKHFPDAHITCHRDLMGHERVVMISRRTADDR